MESMHPWFSQHPRQQAQEEATSQPQTSHARITRVLEQELIAASETVEMTSVAGNTIDSVRQQPSVQSGTPTYTQNFAQPGSVKTKSASPKSQFKRLDMLVKTTIDMIDTLKVPTLPATHIQRPNPHPFRATTHQYPERAEILPQPQSAVTRSPIIQRGSILLLASLLFIVIVNAMSAASPQFIGPQGWAYVLGGAHDTNDPDLLNTVSKQFQNRNGKQGNSSNTTHVTPEQFVAAITQHMTLEQKLGQLMIVQFIDGNYSTQLDTMINQYNVGAVLIMTANNNVQDKEQLQTLIQAMQNHSKPIPLAVSIDQEGGMVDRLIHLDGARPSAATIGATGDTTKAEEQGAQDAQDLSSYGINLNLAPVVDVTRVYNPQMDTRTYGSDPQLVTHMAAAYLQGLQKSGKVFGTLKHFPGLGDVGTDPHNGVPYVTASKDSLEQIAWAPYRSLIQQGSVHAVMVTHDVVEAVDPSEPSSLSHTLITDILRNELGFKGVVITDSLTMRGLTNYADESDAAAMAIEAGADLLMGASSADDVVAMETGIKKAISSGQLTEQRIDESVQRILLMKYQLGLIRLPTT